MGNDRHMSEQWPITNHWLLLFLTKTRKISLHIWVDRQQHPAGPQWWGQLPSVRIYLTQLPSNLAFLPPVTHKQWPLPWPDTPAIPMQANSAAYKFLVKVSFIQTMIVHQSIFIEFMSSSKTLMMHQGTVRQHLDGEKSRVQVDNQPFYQLLIKRNNLRVEAWEWLKALIICKKRKYIEVT